VIVAASKFLDVPTESSTLREPQGYGDNIEFGHDHLVVWAAVTESCPTTPGSTKNAVRTKARIASRREDGTGAAPLAIQRNERGHRWHRTLTNAPLLPHAGARGSEILTGASGRFARANRQGCGARMLGYWVEYTPTPPTRKSNAHVAQPAGATADEYGR
jgi:hypothetical protein